MLSPSGWVRLQICILKTSQPRFEPLKLLYESPYATLARITILSREERDLGLQDFRQVILFCKNSTSYIYVCQNDFCIYFDPQNDKLYKNADIICKQANVSVSTLPSMPYPACYYIWLWLDFHSALFLVKNVILTHNYCHNFEPNLPHYQ